MLYSLFILEAIKSPNCPAILNTTDTPKIAKVYRYILSILNIFIALAYSLLNVNCKIIINKVPPNAPITVPAIDPSILFLGLILGHNLCLPNLTPN